MKRIKQSLAMLLALIMVMGLALTASAAVDEGAFTITIKNNKDDHTYEAYQIFSGELVDGTLLVEDWGTGVKGSELNNQLHNNELTKSLFQNKNTFKEVVEVISGISNNSSEAKAIAKVVDTQLSTVTGSTNTKTVDDTYVISNLPAGYYLIKDKVGTVTGEDDAYTNFILQVVGNVEVTPKSDIPTVDKQVEDTEDPEAGATAGWGDSADHAMFEEFQFKLTAELPATIGINDYKKYTVIFSDYIASGLTFVGIDSVTIDNITVTDSTSPAYSLTGIAEGESNKTWTLTLDNVKDFSDLDFNQDITIEVVYTAYLNENAFSHNNNGIADSKNVNTVKLQYSNNPNVVTDYAWTTQDDVFVFTYEVDNTKYDGEISNNVKLDGVGFALYDSTGQNKIDLFKDGAVYRPVNPNATTPETPVENMVSDDEGKFNIVGLDAGTYVLKETAPLEGYTACEDITIVIKATHLDSDKGTNASVTFEQGTDNMNNNIENFKGTSLPSTGGIGTTIFYVVGGIMVFAAAVLLITRKRMKSVEK